MSISHIDENEICIFDPYLYSLLLYYVGSLVEMHTTACIVYTPYLNKRPSPPSGGGGGECSFLPCRRYRSLSEQGLDLYGCWMATVLWVLHDNGRERTSPYEGWPSLTQHVSPSETGHMRARVSECLAHAILLRAMLCFPGYNCYTAL